METLFAFSPFMRACSVMHFSQFIVGPERRMVRGLRTVMAARNANLRHMLFNDRNEDGTLRCTFEKPQVSFTTQDLIGIILKAASSSTYKMRNHWFILLSFVWIQIHTLGWSSISVFLFLLCVRTSNQTPGTNLSRDFRKFAVSVINWIGS